MSASIIRRAILVLACFAWVGSVGFAQAASLSFTVPLSGAQQVPAVKTPGSGSAALTYDPSTQLVTWAITYSGLSSPVTMAHFHGPAAVGKNGPVKEWLSKMGEAVSSPIKGEATLSAADAQQFVAGDWYINVHTKDNPAGEIRGQVVPPKG